VTCVEVGGQLKCGGSRSENLFRLSAKRTRPFKSAGPSVQSTSNSGHTMFRGSMKSTRYPLHSSVPLHFPTCASPCAITFQFDCTVKYDWWTEVRNRSGISMIMRVTKVMKI